VDRRDSEGAKEFHPSTIWKIASDLWDGINNEDAWSAVNDW